MKKQTPAVVSTPDTAQASDSRAATHRVVHIRYNQISYFVCVPCSQKGS